MALSSFDVRVQNTLEPFKSAQVEVADTAEAMWLAMEQWGLKDPALLLGLTRLALERAAEREA